MKAVQITSLLTSTDQLQVASLPDLQPSPDHYIVRVQAASINVFDALQVQGKHQTRPPLPFVAGNEFAGVVVSAPTAATAPAFRPGDRVFGGALGAFATQIAVREQDMRRIPAGWSALDASSAFLTAPTAYTALVHRAHARAGETVLVHGAAGGVGLAAVQVAAALGLVVIAVTNSARKTAACRAFGAHHVIDITQTPDWQAAARACTPGGRGVDIVVDPLGLVDRSLKCIAWNGRVVVVGFAAGGGTIEKVAMNKLLLKNCSVSGIFWGRYATEEPETVAGVWEALLALMDAGKIRSTLYSEQTFRGLASLPAAFRLGATGEAWGKIAVSVEEGSRL